MAIHQLREMAQSGYGWPFTHSGGLNKAQLAIMTSYKKNLMYNSHIADKASMSRLDLRGEEEEGVMTTNKKNCGEWPSIQSIITTVNQSPMEEVVKKRDGSH